MRRLTKGAFAKLVTAILVAVMAGSAIAYWSGAGAGSAQTRLGDPLPLMLTAGTPTAQLYPGGHASVAVIAGNPNPYSVQIGSLALDTGTGTDGYDVDPAHSGCDLSSLGFATQDNGAAGWSVPPKTGDTNGSLPIGMPGSLSMSTGAANACQGAIITVHLAVDA